MLTAEIRRVAVPPTVMPLPKPSFLWTQILELAHPFLKATSRRMNEQVQEFEPEIAACVQDILATQGKQLRPILVSLSGQAAGKITDDHVTAAVIIEMVHLATLVHDDIIDEAKLRRHRPTLAVDLGNEVSVLLGDCLFAHALKLAASFPTPEICRAVASATNIICTGEILQTQQRGNFQLSRSEYFRILAMKTAELFALSCDLGALLSDAASSARQALRQFGIALGTAYQIYDDCLDLFGSKMATGKTLGTDLAKGKITLPILIALEKADPFERAELLKILEQRGPENFSRLLEWLAKFDVLNESSAVIEQFLKAGRDNLSILPSSKSRDGLMSLTEHLAQQTSELEIIS
ncbi:MAG: polyprenyl synthetase family protein [Verrucomicrobiota bacterium]|nr:polyprenyl synthetase family protein [Verrucomicrobiota bacterium]